MKNLCNRSSTDPAPRYTIIQYGARHSYAIPLAFHRALALNLLYTDLSFSHGIGELSKLIPWTHTRLGGAINRRTPPVEISDYVIAFGGRYIFGLMIDTFRNYLPLSSKARSARAELIDNAIGKHGLNGATHLYSMFGEGGTLLKRAKESGLITVGDVYIALSADPIVYEESLLFPDWCSSPCPPSLVEEQALRNASLLNYSDVLVCPSTFVRDDLVQNHGVKASKCIVAPYGVNTTWTNLLTRPEAGRILFAGTASLRKGIHYLAEAATQLKGVCTVRIAGIAPQVVREHPLSRDLIFLGHLTPEDMANEFSLADVFVLPTLAEGSAGVTAEALGAGVPVITTAAAGSIVRHGIDGLVIPERDPKALKDAIETVVTDRALRESMSKAARQRAREFTWDRFALEVIRGTDGVTRSKS